MKASSKKMITEKKIMIASTLAMIASIIPAANASRCYWGPGGGVCDNFAPRRRSYNYNRRSSRNGLDLVSELLVKPMYEFNSLFNSQFASVHENQRSMRGMLSPRHQIHQLPDNAGMELVIELPGISPKEVSVELQNSKTVRIRAQRTQDGYESTYNQTFEVDDSLDANNLTVTMSNGILTITAPSKQHATRKIPIENLSEAGEEAEPLKISYTANHVKKVKEENREDKSPKNTENNAKKEIIDEGLTISEEEDV